MSELYCYCREEEKGFMIKCDGCQLWFHGPCVQMTKKLSKAVEYWYCMWCNICRNATMRLEQEQEKISSKMLSLGGELDKLKAAVEMHQGDCHKLRDDKVADTDNDSKSSTQETLITALKTCEKLTEENISLKNENISLKRKYDDIFTELDNLKQKEKECVKDAFTEVDSLKMEIACKQKELDNVKLDCHKARVQAELDKKNLSTELDEAYGQIRSLRELNENLQLKVSVRNKRLSLSQR